MHLLLIGIFMVVVILLALFKHASIELEPTPYCVNKRQKYQMPSCSLIDPQFMPFPQWKAVTQIADGTDQEEKEGQGKSQS